MTSGLVVVTAGPSYEPIDEVRRLTNSSTGELGVLLANVLADQRWPVLLLLGSGASVRGPLRESVRMVEFTTNEDLQSKLATLAPPVAAVFHCAALCDFRVKSIAGAERQPKISTRAGDLTLVLEPAAKILNTLRILFPQSLLVGWKYELNGDRDQARGSGRGQLRQNATDLCILNGRAWGPGFGILDRDGSIVEQPDKAALCTWLAAWLKARSLGFSFP